MTPELNDLLDEVRLTMTKERAQTEAAWGPDMPKVAAHSHETGQAGVGGADNVHDANDAVDKFIADVVDQLMLTVGMGEDEAFDFVFDFLDSESGGEHLPTLPGDDADPEELATWLGKATTLGVAAKIVKSARGE